jgi:hypothetical protein
VYLKQITGASKSLCNTPKPYLKGEQNLHGVKLNETKIEAQLCEALDSRQNQEEAPQRKERYAKEGKNVIKLSEHRVEERVERRPYNQVDNHVDDPCDCHNGEDDARSKGQPEAQYIQHPPGVTILTLH